MNKSINTSKKKYGVNQTIIVLSTLLIKVYQYCLSPYKINSCRFEPSCSNYLIQALKQFGLIRGLILFLKRFSKCQPFCSHYGYDPLPKSKGTIN